MALPTATANTVRTALAAYALADPWRKTWLTSAAGRTAWANGIIAELEVYKTRAADPYMQARYRETRAAILVPSQTSGTRSTLDAYVGIV